MTTAEAFLADIIARRDDDTPRLIFADWLDEHGQEERAEFIRVQCELAARHWDHVTQPAEAAKVWHDLLPEEPCRACWLEHRERELFDADRADWTFAASEGIPPRWLRLIGSFLQSGKSEVLFSRGFVSAVTCSATDWLAHADALTAACPLERVTLTTWPRTGPGGDDWRRLLRHKLEWPGIAFTLPRGEDLTSINEMNRQIRQAAGS